MQIYFASAANKQRPTKDKKKTKRNEKRTGALRKRWKKCESAVNTPPSLSSSFVVRVPLYSLSICYQCGWNADSFPFFLFRKVTNKYNFWKTKCTQIHTKHGTRNSVECKLTHFTWEKNALAALSLFFACVPSMLMASSLFENSNLRYVVLDTNAGQ